MSAVMPENDSIIERLAVQQTCLFIRFVKISKKLFRHANLSQIFGHKLIVAAQAFVFICKNPRKGQKMKYRFTEPIEKKRSSSYGTNYYVCKSRKLSRRVTAFSTTVFDCMMLLEADAKVAWYCERPLKIDFFMDGEKKTICPDLYVAYADGTDEFLLVRNTTDEETSKLIALVSSWGKQSGESIKVMTADDIYKGPFYIRNICLIAARARRCKTTDKSSDRAFLGILREIGPASIGDLIERGYLSRVNAITYIADLYFRGFVGMRDISNTPISFKTEVNVNANEKI